MIRITITVVAFEAIAATLRLGSVGFERAPDAKSERQIWLERFVLDRLGALRGLDECYNDVILEAGEGLTAGGATRRPFRRRAACRHAQ